MNIRRLYQIAFASISLLFLVCLALPESLAAQGDTVWQATITITSKDAKLPTAEVTFGVNPDATDGFDSGIDVLGDVVPAPIDPNTPYRNAFFASARILKTDIKPAGPWTLMVQSNRDFTLSWDVSSLPPRISPTLDPGDGTPVVDMRTTNQKEFPDGGSYKMVIEAARITPALLCQPDSGTAGETVRVTGSNFDANEKAGKLTTDGEALIISAVGDTEVRENEIYADESGEFVVEFVIPKRPGGSVVLAVGEAETTLEIKAKITLSPESGKAGTSISLTGEGFGKSEKIQIDFGEMKNTKEVNSQADGSFVADFQVEAQEPGEKLVTVTGATSNISETKTFVLTPSVPESVEVSADETTLIADNTRTSAIAVSVKDADGIAVIGETIILETDLGSVMSPATDNKDGTYSATYTSAKEIGQATVTATAESNGKSNNVKITLIPGAALTIKVVAVPAELSADGSSLSTITITVKDKNENPVDSALVEMNASLGDITSPAEYQSNGDYIATYTAARTKGKVSITATASGQVSDGTEPVHYSIEGKAEITLTHPPSLTLEPTDGPIGIKIKVTGEYFEPNTDAGKLTINGVETSVAGVGETVVIDGSIWAGDDGTFVVRCLVPKLPGGGVMVAVGEGTTRFVITAQISNVAPEKAPAGTTVKVQGDGFDNEETINVDFGDTKKIATGKTTSDGSFEVTFEADVQEVGTKEIVVTGFLSERTAKANFELLSSEPATISMEANPPEIVADGVSTSKLTITVKDANGYGVSGQTITVTPSVGEVSPVEYQGNGVYFVTYTSDTKAGKVTISASTENDITAQTEITLKPGPPETVTIEANPDSLTVSSGATATLTISVTDKFGNANTGEKIDVILEPNWGLVSDVADNGDGTYTATYTAGDKAGKVKITSSVAGVEGSFELTLSLPPWDVNGDGEVDIVDLVTVGLHFGESGENVTGDVNNDGTVDIIDLVLVGIHFGESGILEQ